MPVPVSKPIFWPLSSLVDRPTCWGEPVTVRCGCTAGTAIRYAWYKKTEHGDVQLHNLADLYLQCGTMDKDSNYYCIAMNDISRQESDILSVQLLMPADNSCVYVINMQGKNRWNITSATLCGTWLCNVVGIPLIRFVTYEQWEIVYIIAFMPHLCSVVQ